MTCVKIGISRTGRRPAMFFPRAAARQASRRLNQIALGPIVVGTLSLALTTVGLASAQSIRVSADPSLVDNSLAYRIDDVILIAYDGTVVLRSDLQSASKPAGINGGRLFKAQLSSRFLEVSPLLTSAFLQVDDPGESRAALLPAPTVDIDRGRSAVLEWNKVDDTVAPPALSRWLHSTILIDQDDSVPDWEVTIHCPIDPVDHLDLSQISNGASGSPASTTFRAPYHQLGWAIFEEIRPRTGQRTWPSSISFTGATEVDRILQSPTDELLPAASRAVGGQ